MLLLILLGLASVSCSSLSTDRLGPESDSQEFETLADASWSGDIPVVNGPDTGSFTTDLSPDQQLDHFGNSAQQFQGQNIIGSPIPQLPQQNQFGLPDLLPSQPTTFEPFPQENFGQTTEFDGDQDDFDNLQDEFDDMFLRTAVLNNNVPTPVKPTPSPLSLNGQPESQSATSNQQGLGMSQIPQTVPIRPTRFH